MIDVGSWTNAYINAGFRNCDSNISLGKWN